MNKKQRVLLDVFAFLGILLAFCFLKTIMEVLRNGIMLIVITLMTFNRYK